MTPVYQTIFDNKKGNCQAAVWASLLHLDLQHVPNFVEFDDDHDAVCKFIAPYGYAYLRYVINPNRRDLHESEMRQYEWLGNELPDSGSVEGYYEAVVYSPGYFDYERFTNDPGYVPVCHAVIVDKELNSRARP
jgi:hypothetical protein